MRLLFWNILHGGGPRRIPEILLTIVESQPDLVVLSEFRTTRGGQLRGVLADHGLVHQVVSHRPGRANGMLAACRMELAVEESPKEFEGREVDLRIKKQGLWVTGVHIADDALPTLKTSHWNRLIGLARERRADRHAIIGDLNTARGGDTGSSLLCGQRLGLLATLGYEDAWRVSNPDTTGATWVSPFGEGRRIDAAFLSRPLAAALTQARHLDDARETGHSDHAPVLVVIETSERGGLEPG